MTTFHLSIDAQICEHMVWELNQSGFQETIRAKHETDPTSMSGPYGTATRTYLPEYEHDLPQEYRVSIYSLEMAQVRRTRVHFQENFLINMVLFKRIDVGDERSKVELEGDKVMLMADELRKWFERYCPSRAKIQDGTELCEMARWLGVSRVPMFGLAEMTEYHCIYVPIIHRWMTIRRLAGCGEEI